MQAWVQFQQSFQEAWRLRKLKWLGYALILGVIAALYAWVQPSVFRANIVIYPEDAQQNTGGLSSVLGNLPIESKGSSTIRAILASHSLRNSVIRDSIVLQNRKEEIAVWLKQDMEKRNFIMGNLMPPSESGEGLYAFANRYLSRIMLIFTDDDGFISLQLSTSNDSLTLALGETLINHAHNYHKIRQELKNNSRVQYLNLRTDSVGRELERVQKHIANYGDRKRYTARYAEEVELQALYQQQTILQQLLVSVTMLKEEASSRSRQEAPLFQVLDPPQKPLDMLKPNPWLYGIAGTVILFIVFMLWDLKKAWWVLMRDGF
jgi:hypothetical protein